MKSKVEFHQGQALLRLAGMYPTLQEVLYEEVQNSLDEGAKHVSISINQRSRHLTVSDDGAGASIDKFDKALRSVGSTIKPTGKLGRWGLGLISPLGKCERFIFTSTTRDDSQAFQQWTFITDDIAKQKAAIEIPHSALTKHRYAPEGATVKRDETAVPWRTQVRIERFSEDHVIGHIDVDTLHEGILDRYGAVMRKHGAVVSIRIVKSDGGKIEREFHAESFAGKPLPEFRIYDKDAGETLFKLYIARRSEKGRRGRVLVGEVHNDYRMHFGVFAYAASEWLDKEVAAALGSGVFEGEIITERAKLHASRKSFEKDAALVGLCGAIGKWFEKVGEKRYREANEQRREERLQELGERSLKVIKSMLQGSEFAFLKEVISGFSFGTIAEKHVPVRGRAGEELIGIRVIGEPSADEGGRDRKSSDPMHKPSEVEGDTPVVALGPKGTRRRLVRDNSLGLSLEHVEFLDPNKLWELDDKHGIIRINTKHPIMDRCERSGNFAVMRLQELLIVEALVLQSMPSDFREQHRLVLDKIVEPYVFTFTEGDVVAGRKLGRKAIIK